tara:strand:+ start:1546 stop:2481 length:936 start_codon:yes stop_codon:yes gene_type:complete
MASEFCKIPPSDDTQFILGQLPALPSINQIVDLINIEVNNLKIKYINKIKEILLSFAEGICPTQQQIDKFIRTRNNIVEQLTKVYIKVDRLSNNISGVANFLSLVLTGIKIASGIVRGITIGGAAIPFPLPTAVNSVVEGAQTEIEKAKFKTDGAQKLVPIAGGIISASIAIRLFVNALRELICAIEALDVSLIECSTPPIVDGVAPTQIEIENFRDEIRGSLTPIPSDVIEFIEQDVVAQEESLGGIIYRGFSFKIEKVPFSSTVNRSRALAQNSNGITLLKTELSFTSTPDILIEELKLKIDQDNLRAE